MALSATEFKFLLRLLEHPPQYRCLIGKIQPTTKRDATYENFCSQGLVGYRKEITHYSTTPLGKEMLSLDPIALPITSDALKLLKAAEKQPATPGQAKGVPADSRQELLRQLQGGGFINVDKEPIKEVWLTAQGQSLLFHGVALKGNITLSSAMLGSYVTFLRQGLGTTQDTETPIATQPHTAQPLTNADSITPETVLNLIQKLDRQLGTDNYLPIFYLREALQPPLQREDLDQLLYGLERSDCIELDLLQEASSYDKQQREAGILQSSGGRLFYISVI